MERIWGPVNGFHIAAYAAPVGDGDRWCSYAKVCWERPASYWEADCAFKLFGGEQHRSAESALASMALHADNEVSYLPARTRRLLALRQQKRLPVPRLFVTLLLRHRHA